VQSQRKQEADFLDVHACIHSVYTLLYLACTAWHLASSYACG